MQSGDSHKFRLAAATATLVAGSLALTLASPPDPVRARWLRNLTLTWRVESRMTFSLGTMAR